MNERIKELARELGPVATIGNWGRVEWSDNVYPQLGDKMYAAIDLQKFTELIVRECASVVENLSPGYKDYRNQIEDAFRRACVEEMKQHFGVE